MTGIAAFADVDISSGEFEWRVETHVRNVLDRLVNGEQRRYLDQTADACHHDDPKNKPDRLALQPIVKSEDRHYRSLRRLRGQLPLGQIAALLSGQTGKPYGHPEIVS